MAGGFWGKNDAKKSHGNRFASVAISPHFRCNGRVHLTNCMLLPGIDSYFLFHMSFAYQFGTTRIR